MVAILHSFTFIISYVPRHVMHGRFVLLVNKLHGADQAISQIALPVAIFFAIDEMMSMFIVHIHVCLHALQ